MSTDPRNSRGAAPYLVAFAVLALLAGAIAGEARPKRRPPTPAPVTDSTLALPDPDVRDTPANLQLLFAVEVNAQARYQAFAQQAVVEHRDSLAALFRACAVAESVHAKRHVEAIATTGAPARAVLEKLAVGTTDANLETALAHERWEVERLYPAMRDRARAQGHAMAVRSTTYALAAERGHLALLEAAKAGRLPANGYWVCGGCGRTVTEAPRGHCPTCFANARRFVHTS